MTLMRSMRVKVEAADRAGTEARFIVTENGPDGIVSAYGPHTEAAARAMALTMMRRDLQLAREAVKAGSIFGAYIAHRVCVEEGDPKRQMALRCVCPRFRFPPLYLKGWPKNPYRGWFGCRWCEKPFRYVGRGRSRCPRCRKKPCPDCGARLRWGGDPSDEVVKTRSGYVKPRCSRCEWSPPIDIHM